VFFSLTLLENLLVILLEFLLEFMPGKLVVFNKGFMNFEMKNPGAITARSQAKKKPVSLQIGFINIASNHQIPEKKNKLIEWSAFPEKNIDTE